MSKIALITGATAGIGKATALTLAENGFDVIITGRRQELLQELKHEIETKHKNKVLALCFDIRNKKAITTEIENLPREWKNIDVLVNNAGLALGLEKVQDGNTDDWDTVIDTNVKGLLYVTRAVAPLMIARNKGHIVNVSSTASKKVYEGGNVYCATKFAVDALSQAMRIDMIKHDIKVTQVCPGKTETEFSMVRFKGDKEKANKVYEGFVSLTAQDIAGIINYVVGLPPHVCINDLVVTPTAQAQAGSVNIKK